MEDKPQPVDAQAQKLRGALSLCKKAGALVAGFDAVQQAATTGQARLVLFASDLSPATRKRVLRAAQSLPVLDMPLEQYDIATITRKMVGVLAVTNQDLAVLCQNSMAQARKEERV